MFVFNCYKSLKEQLQTIAPVFIYRGQYLPGKTNVNHILPAIFIELPKDSNLTFFGRRLLAMKPATFKLHYASHAPYKANTNAVQESALIAHSDKLVDIDTIMSQVVLKDNAGNLLTQHFIPTGINELNYQDDFVYSVITYTTELYSRHRQ